MTMDIHNLVRMANRIGDFFDSMPCRDEALAGISDHIRKFWAPRMRQELLQHVDDTGGEGLSEILLESLKQHRDRLSPAQPA